MSDLFRTKGWNADLKTMIKRKMDKWNVLSLDAYFGQITLRIFSNFMFLVE